MLEALLMIPSLIVSLIYPGYDLLSFVITILLILLVGVILSMIKPKSDEINAMEGLAIVVLGWVGFSAFGSLPFIISGAIPSVVDAFFETVSGFTTTGATLLLDIESIPKGLLFWRSFTHWIGGMGILVFTLALLPTLRVGGFHIFKAESPGPVKQKIVPKIKDSAKILYITYFLITLTQIILLLLGGMSLYDACVHTFGTVGTGGFSNKAASVAAYDSSYIHVIISLFMIISGGNFALYFALYKGRVRDFFKDEELRLYLFIVIMSTLLIAFNLVMSMDYPFLISIRDSLFQTSSIITTTGYATANYDLWPAFSKSILFMLMFVGGCAGSTTGAIKNIRILVMLKLIKREVSKIFHPRAMIPVKVNDKALSSDTVSGILSFFALYILIFIIATITVSLEGNDLESASSAVAATLGNVGPGFGLVGPTMTFEPFSAPMKVLFSFLMLLGRLELFTIIAFAMPRRWRNRV